LKDALVFDLLEAEVYQKLLKQPNIISESIANDQQLIVIDEIQKLPSLLDEVHRLIQKRKITFLLTGSSARKLKHGGANLLAGRARNAYLFPLTASEIDNFDLNRYLNQGGLPEIYDSNEPYEDLESYVANYLREEIQAEAVTRSVQAFAEFLDLVALSNGQEINMESFASDCQVSPTTIKSYFQILEDTMIGFRLPGYVKTKKRKAISRSKFYLFDIGVANFLAKRKVLSEGSAEFGNAFEHFIALELRAYLSYNRIKEGFCYWRTTSQIEVDFVIGNSFALEIKATKLAHSKHLKGLRALREEGCIKRFLIVSFDSQKRITEDGIEIYPWKQFINELWGGKMH
jgi:uncharacterized protein